MRPGKTVLGRVFLARGAEIRYTASRNLTAWEGRAMRRIDKENYYLDIAETVLERSTCLRRC